MIMDGDVVVQVDIRSASSRAAKTCGSSPSACLTAEDISAHLSYTSTVVDAPLPEPPTTAPAAAADEETKIVFEWYYCDLPATDPASDAPPPGAPPGPGKMVGYCCRASWEGIVFSDELVELHWMYYGDEYEWPVLPSTCVVTEMPCEEEESLRLSQLQLVRYTPAAAACAPLPGSPNPSDRPSDSDSTSSASEVPSPAPGSDSCSSARASAQVPSSRSFASKLRAGAMGLGARLAGAYRALVAKLLRVIKPSRRA